MEYNSISDFKSNFAKLYHSQVVPALGPIEQERKQIFKKAVILTMLVLCTAAVLLLCGCIFTADLLSIIGVIVGIVGFLIYPFMQKGFENKLKSRIMPSLMKAFGDFTWTNSQVINTGEIRAAKIFSRFDDRSVDDNFYGTYRGMPIEISETKLTYETRDTKGRRHTYTTFKGVLISIGVGKHFEGHTIIREREFLFNRKCYEEVKLEDPEFAKKFFVDANNQVEARYLLTTAFMERFKKMTNAFGAKCGECSFKDQKLLIALSTEKDLFSLGNLKTPVNDTTQFKILLKEFISILEMIDHLKITEKIGL